MSYLTDGTSVVSFDVLWNSLRNSELIINRARTVEGREADYLWGKYDKWQLRIKNMQSADTNTVNNWWSDSTQLNFYFDQTSYSVLIVSDNQPFQNLARPYQTEWSGVVNLENI